MNLPAVRDEVGLQMTGKEVIASATEWANALMAVVEDRKLYATIGKKKHLVAEAWETIGAFDRVAVDVAFVNPLQDSEDKTNGYQAKVNLLKDGVIISSGIMSCGFEEFPCRGKQGMAKHRAAMSAAQTWAMAKAYRMKYSYVAVLAGFDATPAEEMRQEAPTPQPTNRRAERAAQRSNGQHTPAAPAAADAGSDDAVTQVFKNLGEFYTAVRVKWGKREDVVKLGGRDAVREALGYESDDEIVADYGKAWAALEEKWR
jgi:hypothetical protein